MFIMKYVFICVAFLTLISCKKEHSCRCSVTVNYPSGKENFNSKTVMLAEKCTKDQAKSICNAEELNLEVTYQNIFSNNGAYPPQVATDAKCTVG